MEYLKDISTLLHHTYYDFSITKKKKHLTKEVCLHPII